MAEAKLVKVPLKRIVERIKAILRKLEISILKAKHEVGKVLLDEMKGLEHGEKVETLKEIGKQVGVKQAELYRSMKFAELYPDFNEFMREHPDVSWHYVVHNLLYEEEEGLKEEKFVECDLCGDEFSSEETKPIRLCLKCSSELVTWMNLKRVQSEGSQKQGSALP